MIGILRNSEEVKLRIAMKKLFITTLLLLSSFALQAKEVTGDEQLQCLQRVETKILGLEDNEINFNSQDCTQEQIKADLKIALAELFTSTSSTSDTLEVNETGISDVLVTLSKDHPGSEAFPLSSIKKIEEFWTGLDASEIKQKGEFATLINDVKKDYYLVLLYTKEMKDLIVVHKAITKGADASDDDNDDTIPPAKN